METLLASHNSLVQMGLLVTPRSGLASFGKSPANNIFLLSTHYYKFYTVSVSALVTKFSTSILVVDFKN